MMGDKVLTVSGVGISMMNVLLQCECPRRLDGLGRAILLPSPSGFVVPKQQSNNQGRNPKNKERGHMAIVAHGRRAPSPAQRRVLEELQHFGAAVCEFDRQNRSWSWKINGRPVSGPLYTLARKGWVEIETPTPGAKAFLKAA
jgi:hypothetical protein